MKKIAEDRIKKLKKSNTICLAPMAGVTDMPFRILCKEQGCELLYSEMVSAKALLYENKNTEPLLEVDEKEHPIGIQLFGSDPQIMADMARKVEEQYLFDFIDINMGCPVPKVVRNGEGSALMLRPKRVEEIVRAVSYAIEKPLTVKIRKGFDENNINAVEIAKIVEESGGAAVAVHGRTREQYYSGKADWDIIKQVKDAVGIPVIGNGDVASPQDVRQMLEQTGCDSIMIGRGAQGNPWIFREAIHYLKTGIILEPPGITEKIQMVLRHAKMLVAYKGEYIGVREMRKQIGWYIKGLPGAAKLRQKINHIHTLESLENELMHYVEKGTKIMDESI